MNKALPAITERPAQLQKRLRAEPDTQKRLRLQALYLLASGQARSRLALARLLVVHRHTIRAWLTRDEARGLNALLRIAKAPGKRSALSPQFSGSSKRASPSPRALGYLADEHHVPLGYSTVHALVCYKLKAKLKAPRHAHQKKSLPRSRSFRLRWLPA